MAQIVSIVYQPAADNREKPPDRFVRVPLDQATLLAEHGIEGDAKAGRHPLRQLNLLSHEWLLERQREGFDVAPGAFGEQIVLQGVAVEALEPGDRLQLGEAAEIEITQPRTGCSKLEAAQGIAADAMWPRVGMLAKVTASGTIRVGDPVQVRLVADGW